MKKLLLLACVLLAAGFVFAQDEPDKPAGATQGTYEVRLVDGTIMIVKSHRFGSKFVILSLGDGSTVAFRREDIELKTLPAKPIQQPDPNARTNRSERLDGGYKPDSMGDRRLHDVASETHLTDDEILIVGDGTLNELADNSSYDESRKKALAQVEAVAERYSESAGNLTKNVVDYQKGCSGYTVTHHKGTTTGAGVFIGSAEGEYDSSWVGGTAGGSVNWGVDSGYTTFTFEGLATWQEEHTWTSTTADSDTPYCQNLWSEILAVRGIVEPVLYNAVQTARLNFVLDSEINTVFFSYGIGPVGFWVPDLR